MKRPAANLLGFMVATAVLAAAMWASAMIVLLPARVVAASAEAEEQALAELQSRVDRVRTDLAALPTLGPDPRIDTDGTADESLQRLQERARSTLTAAGGALVVTEAKSETLAPAIAALHVIVRIRLTEPALMTYLKTLESARPKIVVEQLDATPSPGDSAGTIDVALTLTSVHRDAG